MNAAFLVVTSAMLLGQGGDKKPAAPAAPAPAVVASSCGPDCGCDRFGHKLRDRLKGLFSRDCCDACKPTACHTHQCHTSLFRSRCEDACKPKWTWEPKCREHKAHCAPACKDPCGRESILDKLRGRFHRHGCCDSGCAGTPAKAPEKVDPPKVMPKGGKAEEVRFETQVPAPTIAPPAPAVIQVAPTVPAVDITPVAPPAPRVDGGRRDPF
ncbi:MAG: hypothetical protein HY289_12670 [Planctomycetes bacterium]|nr:hypothetical protein [Planctomycetota bacterium]